MTSRRSFLKGAAAASVAALVPTLHGDGVALESIAHPDAQLRHLKPWITDEREWHRAIIRDYEAKRRMWAAYEAQHQAMQDKIDALTGINETHCLGIKGVTRPQDIECAPLRADALEVIEVDITGDRYA
jgi:hypothetical protein